MKWIACFLKIAWLLTLLTGSAARGTSSELLDQALVNDIVLSRGMLADIDAPSGQRIHVSNGHVVSVKDRGGHVQITAKKLGLAQIRAGTKLYNIQIVEKPLYDTYARLQSTLKEMRGLKLNLVDSHIVVSGRLLRLSDWQKLASQSSLAHRDYQFQAEIDPLIAHDVAQFLEDLFKKQALPIPHISLIPMVSVQAGATDSNLKLSWEKLLNPLGLELGMNSVTLVAEPLIQVDLILAEVNHAEGRNFGIEWPSEYEATLLPNWGTPADIKIKLKALASSGQGQILASPRLVARSGGRAEFLAGGEFPIRLTGGFRQNQVEWKQHGVMLKIEPQADPSGQIRMSLKAELSLLDNSQAVEGVPALKTNRVESQFDLSNGQTVALSGLLRHDWGEASSGLPWLGQIPILGALFKSKSFQAERSELVVFVTPTLAPTHSRIKLPQGFKRPEEVWSPHN